MNMQKNISQEQNIISWKTDTGHYREKSVNWYWLFWFILGIIIFAIYYFNIGANSSDDSRGQIILMVLIAISGLTITMASIVRPHKRVYTISKEELILDKKKSIPLSKLESYKIDIETRELLLKYTSPYQPLIVLPLSPLVNLRKLKYILERNLALEEDLKSPGLEKSIGKSLGI